MRGISFLIFALVISFFVISAQEAFAFCSKEVFISSVDPQNVVVGQEFNGQMIVELSCVSIICEVEPKIDYGDGIGIQTLSGGECKCSTEDPPVKNVRCSYDFTYSYNNSGQYVIIPKGGYWETAWGSGASPVSYDFTGSGSAKINVFEKPSPGPGTGAGNPLSTSTVAGLVKTATNVIYIIAYALTVLFVMLGGFMIITSSGNPEQVSKGRKIVLYTIIAFAILILARGLVNLILMIIDVPTRI